MNSNLQHYLSSTISLALLLLMQTACSSEESKLCFPPEIQKIFVEKCSQCHNDTLEFGAPMSLEDWAITRSLSSQNRSMLDEISIRIHSQSEPMPPQSLPALQEKEVQVIDSWIASGGKEGETDCSTK